ncbi:MAG: transporter substrate-binding domain-containing protein [Oscillospiraceae bacterium]|nr:transporter substrate-binding domain-containing protein [Oscillospiraceae bacterium]
MKKIIALLLVLTMALGLAACGGSAADTTADTAADAAAETPAYFADLQTPGKIVIATSPDYPPYESYDAAGNIVGFDIDAINEVIKILNEDYAVEAEWVPMDFSTIISAVQSGQADIGVSCFTYEPEREGQVLFSDAYLKSAQVAVVKADSDMTTIDDLAGKTIGAGSGTTGESAASEIEGTTVTSMGDYVQMFEILKNGGLDAVVCDEAVGQNYASQDGYKLLDGKLVDEEVSVITATDSTELVSALNAAIAKFVASDKYTELKTTWGLN